MAVAVLLCCRWMCLFNNSKSHSDFSTLQSLSQYATPLDRKATCSGTDWPRDPVSCQQYCFASPICWEVKTSLSGPVNERLKWPLANSAHLPWRNINHQCFQGRRVIKWTFSRDGKGMKNTAMCHLLLPGTNLPHPHKHPWKYCKSGWSLRCLCFCN